MGVLGNMMTICWRWHARFAGRLGWDSTVRDVCRPYTIGQSQPAQINVVEGYLDGIRLHLRYADIKNVYGPIEVTFGAQA